MLFEETWQPEVLPAPSISVPSGTVVCFLSDPGHQHVVRRVFERLGGDRVRIVFVAQEHAPGHEAAPETYVVSKAARHTYEAALRRLREAGHEVGAILYLWALEDPQCIRDYTPVVYLLQAMVAAHLKPERILLAGECAPGYSVDRCYLESWIGFERSLGLVLPHTQVVPIYAAVAGNAASSIEDWATRLWDELRTPQGRAVLYQDDIRHVCRILPCDLASGSDPLRAHGTYLITGGLGGLGLLFARHLAVTRPVNLILTGRSAASATQQARINELEALGARVSVLRADVADEVAMREGLAAVLGRFGEINGVIHAAGIVGGRSLFEKDIEHFRQVLAPKVQGCLVLDELIDPKGLDFICYFSSSAAILGDFGSCDYAIGNRFQMAFARYQAQRPGRDRIKALAINWPLWRGVGMGAGDAEHIRMMLKSSGQRHLEAEEGLALFDRILAQDGLHPLVLAGQPSRVHRFLGLGSISHRERTGGEGLQRRVHAPSPGSLPGGEGKVAEPLEAGERRGRCLEMQGLSLYECVVWDLRELAAQLLQTPREQLHPHENLADFGFDSLSLTDFAARLTAHYHHEAFPVNITPSLLFGYPSFDKLAAFLLQEYRLGLAEYYRETTPIAVQPAIPERDTARPAASSLSKRETGQFPAAAASGRPPVLGWRRRAHRHHRHEWSLPAGAYGRRHVGDAGQWSRRRGPVPRRSLRLVAVPRQRRESGPEPAHPQGRGCRLVLWLHPGRRRVRSPLLRNLPR